VVIAAFAKNVKVITLCTYCKVPAPIDSEGYAAEIFLTKFGNQLIELI
jgi:hypothetical protein